MNADKLLTRLDRVKKSTAHHHAWTARCPAHDDRGPSLSIRETDDGRVLVHCFAGCDVHSVLAAVGMDITDLFPPRLSEHRVKSERRPFPAADVLASIGFEALVVRAAASAMLDHKPLSEADSTRLTVAVARIQSALRLAGVSNG